MLPRMLLFLHGSNKCERLQEVKAQMTKTELAARLKNACAAVLAAEDELTEIDSRFGDADHGLTMAKIAGAIGGAADQPEGGIRAMLDGAAMAVMTLNGGSAVPLWNTWLDGLQEDAPERTRSAWRS